MAAEARTMPTFAVRRWPAWCLKKSRSAPTTIMIIAAAKIALVATFPMAQV